MAKYCIALCNLDMAETLEEVIRGILRPLDDRFEVLVIDGGSTDGSVEILTRLSEEFDALRYVTLPRETSRNLGVDRTMSVLAADADYVIGAIDVDEHYYEGAVLDFVDVFEQLNEQIGDEFVLHGSGMYIAPKSLHEKHLFPNVSRGEDQYFWTCLFANDDVIWLKHHDFGEAPLGYERNLLDQLEVDFEEKTTEFQFGVSLTSCYRWALEWDHPYILERRRGTAGDVAKRLYDAMTWPLAFLNAIPRDSYNIATEFQQKGAIERTIRREEQWLHEVEEDYGVTVDYGRLSNCEKSLFER